MVLAGKRVLVVEDEMLVAMNLEDMLVDMNATVVGPAMRLETALDLARTEEFDLAVLDINLHGGRSYPVAEVLRERGIPFVFASGYGHPEGVDAFAGVPTLTKPYRGSDLKAALVGILSRPGGMLP